jgi:glucose-6-phosphate isomerase
VQESAGDDPGRCFAVTAEPGEVVIVPPGWAHATISADPSTPLTFGAWCDRDYGFEYGAVRAHKGLAFYPLLSERGDIQWKHNDRYLPSELIHKGPEKYINIGLGTGVPIYTQYVQDRERFMFVSDPKHYENVWDDFVP